ncbi:MAG TPA: hypothetical protein VKE42_02820, partial [Candidatus Cybelea sp.]|nr:hypothetical protein [Candidatus Cybelea sp.]
QTIEPTLKRALEGASFITAFDRIAILRVLGVQPKTFDATAAHELAVKQGLGVVVSGSVERQGSGYSVAMKATGTLTGNVLADLKGRASSKDQILGTATRLVASVRKALGDEATESAQIFAMTNLSATSLDVVAHYTAAQEAASRNKFEEARDHALKAVELDPNFGIGYQVLSVASRNMHNQEDADKYAKAALSHIDGMTERERYTTRGYFLRLSGDYQGCVKEYGELVTRFAADVVGRNQHALCSTQLRNFKPAIDEMRGVVDMLPNRATFRDNLAIYLNYAGDFQGAEKEARTIQEPDAYATLAIAFAQLGQGKVEEAIASYNRMAGIGNVGALFAPLALGDAAAVQGRYSDAVLSLTEGARTDLEGKNAGRAATKYAAIAYTQLSRGQNAAAIASADQVLANTTRGEIRFLAARVFVETGAIAKAEPLMASLSADLRPELQAYGKIIQADIALKRNIARDAIKPLNEAN